MKELLEKMISVIESEEFPKLIAAHNKGAKGLCGASYLLTFMEIWRRRDEQVFDTFIRENRPYEDAPIFGLYATPNDAYFFKPGDWKIRIKWLKYLLSNLETK